MEELKRRLPFADLMAIEGVPLRRSGALLVAHCPFHQEKSCSFTVYVYPDSREDHAHCFGCGWNGDIIAFIQSRRGGGFVDAVALLASLASLPPEEFKQKVAAKMPRMTEVARKPQKTAALPRMRLMTAEESRQLANLRKLDVQAVAYAASPAVRRVGMCMWPQYSRNSEEWFLANDASPCWVVSDHMRYVAQFRRLDGANFTTKDGGSIKCWTKGSPTWPLGAAEIGERGCVLLVEGGADMLAAWHFLLRYGRQDVVAVCSMLGASCSICDEALSFFRQKRVRIMMDEDSPKPVPNHPEKPPIYPGREAAARWTVQLCAAGAAVESFSLAGLTRADGQPVKDLNDLVFIDDSAWRDPELKQAFMDFDF